MSFTPGTYPDKQSRVARTSQDQNQLGGPLPLLLRGQDAMVGATWLALPPRGAPQSVANLTFVQGFIAATMPAAAQTPVRPIDVLNPSFAVPGAQSRIARLSADGGQWDALLPVLQGQDRIYGAAGEAPNYDYPNPSFAVSTRQSATARLSADTTQFDTPLPALLGKDSFFSGSGAGPDYDYPNPSFITRTRGQYIAAVAADVGTGWDAYNLELIGQDKFAVGAQATDQQYRVAPRARDYTWTQTFDLASLGPPQQFPIGEAVFEQDPLAAPRARDYSFSASYFQGLIGQDALPKGVQLSGNVPAAAARARDYSVTASFPLYLIGQDQLPTGEQANDQQYRVVPRARDYSITASFDQANLGPLNQLPVGQDVYDLTPSAPARTRDYSFAAVQFQGLSGQDVFNIGVQLSGNTPAGPLRASTLSEPGINLTILLPVTVQPIPAGARATDLPPSAAPRVRDYSITASYFQGLIGADQFTVGGQLSGNAPATALRLRDYTFTASFPLFLIGQDQLPSGDQALDQQYRPVPRARDYSITASFPFELIGQDAVPTGKLLSGNAPAGPARASTLSETGANQLLDLIALPPVMGPGQSTGLSDAPPRGTLRAREYGQTAGFPLELIGQDQFNVGASTAATELPSRAAARARDYTFTASYFQGLTGQDTLFGKAGEAQAFDWTPPVRTLPRSFALYDPGVNNAILLPFVQGASLPGQQSFDLPPRALARARDYTFSASYFAGLAGQDVFNAGAQLSGNAPAGARRANDYTQTSSFPLELIGRDALTTGAQSLDQQFRSVPRSRDYTWVQAAITSLGPPQQFPAGEAVFDLPPICAARARDYTLLGSFPLELVGRDVLATGAQLSGNTPAGARRANDYTFLASFPIGLIGKDVLPNGLGGQVQFDWPLPRPGVPRSYAVYEPGVNGTILLPVSLPFGMASEDLPPRKPSRASEYGHVYTFPLEMRGTDQFNPGGSSASTELPPKGPARLSDYTWLQSLPLYVYQQLPPGQSTGATELSPRAPARAQDYTWLQSLKPYLVGQDTLFGVPGEVPAYDWQNPRGPARLVDYTWLQSFGASTAGQPPVVPVGAQSQDLAPVGARRLQPAGYAHLSATPFSLVAKTRDIIHHFSPPSAKWIVGRIPPQSRWRVAPPRQ